MKLTTTTFVSVAGVMQGIGNPDEDRRGGFDRGGWTTPLWDGDAGAYLTAIIERADAFLFGRWTYDGFASSWGAVVGCFAPDYVNETPAHPGRGFAGHDQAAPRSRIFAGVPAITAHVLRTAVDGTTVWSEWELRATRHDGVPHLMRGVILFEVRDGLAASARFYLKPVDAGDGGGGGCRRPAGRAGSEPVNALLDAKAPRALVGMMTPVLRLVLRTPLGRLVRPFGLLEFSGRRTGRRYRVPVGVHQLDGTPVVFTPPRGGRTSPVGGR